MRIPSKGTEIVASHGQRFQKVQAIIHPFLQKTNVAIDCDQLLPETTVDESSVLHMSQINQSINNYLFLGSIELFSIQRNDDCLFVLHVVLLSFMYNVCIPAFLFGCSVFNYFLFDSTRIRNLYTRLLARFKALAKNGSGCSRLLWHVFRRGL